MKPWRRTSRSAAATAAAAAPTILSVVANGTPDVNVTFSANVTILFNNVGGFTIAGDPMIWSLQISPTVLQAESDALNNHAAGQAWNFTGPDANLTPQPATPQNGVTT